MYAIKSYSLNLVTWDDNWAYTQRRTTKPNYLVTRKSNSAEMKVEIGHKNNRGEYLYKQRDDRYYTDVLTVATDIYTVERYYRQNKSISSLRNLTVQVKHKWNQLQAIFMLFVPDDQTNITKVILLYNLTAALSFK